MANALLTPPAIHLGAEAAALRAATLNRLLGALWRRLKRPKAASPVRA